MLHEFRRSETASFTLPQPITTLTRRAAALIAEDASQAATIDDLARALGTGARTLERHFVLETGLMIGRWRQQRFLLRALEQLATGKSVKACIRCGILRAKRSCCDVQEPLWNDTWALFRPITKRD